MCFEPIQDNLQMSFLYKRSSRTTENQQINLDMIMMMQKDEPDQRSCIYMLKKEAPI